MEKTTFSYFLKGFSLANRSLDIFVISLFFLLFGQFSFLFQDLLVRNILQLIDFILLFFNFGFFMSIPVFLLWKQQNKSLNYHVFWSTLTRNTKRMIIPTILYLILIMIVGFSFLFAVAATIHPANSQQFAVIIQNFTNQLKNWNPLFIINGAIVSLFVFTSIYFSVENNGFFASAKKSLAMSLKNLNFIVIIILISATTYSISTLLSIPSNSGSYLISIAISQYVSLVVIASTLYYYQSR